MSEVGRIYFVCICVGIPVSQQHLLYRLKELNNDDRSVHWSVSFKSISKLNLWQLQSTIHSDKKQSYCLFICDYKRTSNVSLHSILNNIIIISIYKSTYMYVCVYVSSICHTRHLYIMYRQFNTTQDIFIHEGWNALQIVSKRTINFCSCTYESHLLWNMF